MNKWVGEFPVRFFSHPSEQWNVALTSRFKHDLIKHTSLSLSPSCVACLGGERKEEFPRPVRGECYLMNQMGVEGKQCSTDFRHLFLTFWETCTLTRPVGRGAYDSYFLYQEYPESVFRVSSHAVKYFLSLALELLNVAPVYTLPS